LIEDIYAASFRAMQKTDLSAVLEIENAACEFPWTEGIFNDCLANGYQAMLYINQGEIQAYSVAQYVVDECHLLNLCVRNDAQNCGLGARMVKRLMNQARKNDMGSIFLEVRASNAAAIHLYDKLGFNEIGLRRDYYPASNGREDALVLAHEIF
jgi:ribosomal-protein-alanine N-acetyltransferase